MFINSEIWCVLLLFSLQSTKTLNSLSAFEAPCLDGKNLIIFHEDINGFVYFSDKNEV